MTFEVKKRARQVDFAFQAFNDEAWPDNYQMSTNIKEVIIYKMDLYKRK